MAPLLDDARLHEFTGGTPLGAAELSERYRRLASGRSPDGSQDWLNWVVRSRSDGVAVGTVQATVRRGASDMTGALAWVIASPHQGRGYATEAATGVADWLEREGVNELVAYIHPRHEASMAVARALGMAATDDALDGEIRWARPLGPG